MKIQITRLPHGEGLPLPAYATAGASGMDLSAAISAPLTIPPGQRAKIPSGFAFAIPPGYEMQIRSRSGLGINKGGVVTHGVGTIDSDYRGEVMLAVRNINTHEALTIHPGDRIAQAVIAPVVRVELTEVDALDDTARGAGGFGSTGMEART